MGATEEDVVYKEMIVLYMGLTSFTRIIKVRFD